MASPLQRRYKNKLDQTLEMKIMYKFDLREAITPFALLKVTQAFRDMKPGDILQVVGDDPKTRREMFKILQTVNYTVVDTEEDGKYYCICFKKEN
jgi:TusA-related sulfurtransferase